MIVAFIHSIRPDHDQLDAIIAARREHLADLEASIEQAGEQCATRHLAPPLRADRTGWPRSAWRIFLPEAARQATALQPEPNRLRASLIRLQRQAEQAASTDPARDARAPRIFMDLQDIDSLR